ncbi:hypothetical protein ONE63_003740 [Megalurothrips usitatus]|uniref:Uncharacterized protein n=1 Tax=Megalurothrips usitatus TaxID=439358 RepID=A0AAV7X7V1_9NEOP|nr:hypothetical protein ONE63_003740 [Megalurothrips usitatus]
MADGAVLTLVLCPGQVTGAGGGFGRVLALHLARRGCLVACADVATKPNAETVRLILEQQQQADKKEGAADQRPAARAYAADLTKAADIEGLVARVIEDFGCVDILVSNAGQLQGGTVNDLSVEQIDLVLDVNLRATVLLARALLPHMRARRRGHIVAVSSASALVGGRQIGVYAATKAGLTHFMTCLYYDLYAEGLENDIHLTTIHPWFMKTYSLLTDAIEIRGFVSLYLVPTNARRRASLSLSHSCPSLEKKNTCDLCVGVAPQAAAHAAVRIGELVMKYTHRPALSYKEFRHRELAELGPAALHEMLSKGYPLREDPRPICQALVTEYTSKGQPLPHDYAPYADQVTAFYKQQDKAVPPEVRGVFGLAG